MIARIFMVLALLLSGTQGVKACSYTPRTPEQSVALAKTVFVGSIKTVENGLAYFTVEKGIKNIKDGQEFQVDVHEDKGTCGINFQPGQRWLYLGNDAPSGSLLLQDEQGREMKENVAYVKEKFGEIPANGSQVQTGTIRQSCAPWDGAAFTITLDNGVSGSVYASLAGLDAKDENALAVYQANGKMQQDSASIVQCPQVKDKSKPEDRPCRSLQGSITIGVVTPDDATGQIKVDEGEYHSLYVFHVKRLKDIALCG